MQCLSFNINSSSPSFPTSPQSQSQTQIGLNSCPPQSQGNSTDGTPRSSSSSSSTQLSPSFNISHEYTLALQANSYNEIRSRIEDQVLVENAIESEDMDSHQLHLSQVLHPNRECVHQALRHTNPKATLTRLVSTYFDHSEDISTLCLALYQCISRARTLYAPITDLLQVFPYDLSSINLSQCNLAFDIFLQFDSLDNPFPSPESHNFNEMRRSFSLLKEQLDQRLHKSRSGGRFLHRAVGGIVGLIATPLCPIYIPSHLKKKQLARTAQLDAASSGTFFHIKDLDTIVCLVDWLHASVENDRDLVRFGLERGRDIYPIYEVVKHLRNNHNKFFDQLKELEEHICLCFNAVNKFRAKLLNQIHLHQSTDS
ncbi:UPF0496 protein At3g19330 [Gossypium raimondii]|uniref:Uncharacterized protein n=1 Tax=Gossypium raimondii TaxID=29730 RepID=A0A0D2T4S9_GOSRA|nr:UPF0496 protein At3g19330 [Gossypium raimondii]KJB70718.1 hypothetical protein B456_011G088600 [Gossypium raimondii]MBA0599395.1 hypothetical protein [Gossypium raimondii]